MTAARCPHCAGRLYGVTDRRLRITAPGWCAGCNLDPDECRCPRYFHPVTVGPVTRAAFYAYVVAILGIVAAICALAMTGVSVP